MKMFTGGFITGAVVAAVVLGVLLAVAAVERPATVTVRPPCYVRVTGFRLPAGARWC